MQFTTKVRPQPRLSRIGSKNLISGVSLWTLRSLWRLCTPKLEHRSRPAAKRSFSSELRLVWDTIIEDWSLLIVRFSSDIMFAVWQCCKHTGAFPKEPSLTLQICRILSYISSSLLVLSVDFSLGSLGHRFFPLQFLETAWAMESQIALMWAGLWE